MQRSKMRSYSITSSARASLLRLAAPLRGSITAHSAGQLKLTSAVPNPGGSPRNDAEILFKQPEPSAIHRWPFA